MDPRTCRWIELTSPLHTLRFLPLPSEVLHSQTDSIHHANLIDLDDAQIGSFELARRLGLVGETPALPDPGDGEDVVELVAENGQGAFEGAELGIPFFDLERGDLVDRRRGMQEKRKVVWMRTSTSAVQTRGFWGSVLSCLPSARRPGTLLSATKTFTLLGKRASGSVLGRRSWC